MRPFSIGIITAEVSPFSKAGGLGDVTSALAKHLMKFGHRVVIVTPYYGFIDRQNIQKELVGEGEVAIGRHRWPVKFLKTTLSPDAPVPVYFVYQDELFRKRSHLYNFFDDSTRYAVFDRAVFMLFERLGQAPDILHCHDWHTGLIPNYLRTEFSKQPFWQKTSTAFTIHNLLYQMQGMWYEVPSGKRDDGRNAPPTGLTELRYVNFAMRGIRHADIISTVSERYATEVLTKKFGEGLDGLLRHRRDRFYGIINGIDYTVFNPSFDEHIPVRYDWNSLDKKLKNKTLLQKELGLEQQPDVPLIGMVHRLTEQKGFNLIMEIMPILLQQPVQFVVVGDGDREYIRFFTQMAKRHPKQVAVPLVFSEPMASKVYAASDMFLMPSRFEPCGISQLISLRYGSIPIIHQTGGLADTITDFDPKSGIGTGFVFHTYTSNDLLVALVRAIETYKYPRTWEHLTWQAMQKSFSWELPARKYVELYKRAIKNHDALE